MTRRYWPFRVCLESCFLPSAKFESGAPYIEMTCTYTVLTVPILIAVALSHLTVIPAFQSSPFSINGALLSL